MNLLDQNLDALTRGELTLLRTAIDERRRGLRKELDEAERLRVENCSRARRYPATRADLTRRLRTESAQAEYTALGHECLKVQDRLSKFRRDARAEFYDAFERRFILEAKRLLPTDTFMAIVEAANQADRREGAV